MKRTLLTAVAASALTATILAFNPDAHLIAGKPKGTAAQKLETAKRNQAHAQGACRAYKRILAGRHPRSHCGALPWLEQVRWRLAYTLGVPEWPWGKLAACESGRRWTYNGPSGFDGGLQFHPGTWSAYRTRSEPAYAYLAPAWQQVRVAERVLAVQGWGAWPACSRKLGLR